MWLYMPSALVRTRASNIFSELQVYPLDAWGSVCVIVCKRGDWSRYAVALVSYTVIND